MAAYHQVYDSLHLQYDYQNPGSALKCSVIEYGLSIFFYILYIFTTLGNDLADETVRKAAHSIAAGTRSSAIAEGPRDASCQLKPCQLLRNSAETTCTTNPEEIKVMKLDNCSGLCVLSMFTKP